MGTNQQAGERPQVFADFARLEDRPGLGLSVPLGREDRAPRLAALADGEQVLLVEPDNLMAEGIAQSLMSGGYRYWYGVLESMAAIQDIDPETIAEREHVAPKG